MARYLGQKFDQKAFNLAVEKLMADMRGARVGGGHAPSAATRTLCDAQFDENVRREENGDPCPW
jgi:hypothetical protein